MASEPDLTRDDTTTPVVEHSRDNAFDSAVADAVQDGLVVMDADLRIVRVNGAFCELSGFDERELVGQTVPYPFWPEGEFERAQRRLREVEDAGRGHFEVVLRRWDGRLVDAVMSAAPALDGAGRIIAYVATYKDLSAPQAQARLERALRRVAAAIAADAPPTEVFGQVVADCAELLGVPIASVTRFDRPDWATRVAAVGVPEDLPRRGALSDHSVPAVRVAHTHRAARVDDLARVDGPLARVVAGAGLRYAMSVPIMAAGTSWGALTVLSPRPGALDAAAEQHLARFAELLTGAIAGAGARERLQEQATILAALQEGLMVLDRSGRITRVNEALCRITGYDAGELVGASPPYPFAVGGAVEELAPVDRTARIERALRRKDGRLVHVVAAVGALHDADGEPTGRAVVYTDISDSVFQARLERALAEVALSSAEGDGDPAALFRLVCERLAGLLHVPAAAVVRFDGDRGHLVGRHAAVALPDELPLSEPGTASDVAGSGEPARIDDYAERGGGFLTRMKALGLRSAVAVPVRVRGRLWGCVAVMSDRARGLPPDTEALLERFAALMSVALANADAVAELQRRATTDALTGLLNHGAFQQRLQAERLRAQRHNRTLALVVFDCDGFKAVNDTHGHPAGDRVLRTIAAALRGLARTSDVPARIGGDEFAVIAPDTDADEAIALAERLREGAARALASLDLRVTLSAGVTDLSVAGTMHDLMHMADTALYWAKHHGRDRTVRYAPGTEHEVTEAERHRRVLRARTFSGLRALARAADRKAGSTAQHGEQVAALCEQLAVRLDWSAERRARLREAALVHDVGTMGVPEPLLRKPGRLSGAEFDQVKTHAPLGAQLVADVLDAEQVAWVRSHHERLDGSGYPDALAGERVPDGARLLAVADAFVAMQAPRPHRPARSPDDALAELIRDGGTRYDSGAVNALSDVVCAGA